MLHYFVADYWTKKRPTMMVVKTNPPASSQDSEQHSTPEQRKPASAPPTPSMPTQITRSASWESWSSSTVQPCSADWHSTKHSWSFSEDYVSFPSLIEDEKDPHASL